MKSYLIIAACFLGFLITVYGLLALLGGDGSAMRDATDAGRALHEAQVKQQERAQLAREIVKAAR